ncbi:hypothetical protein GCM10022222_02460 [Amycolatopsis ultiminotia]|uniref:DUF664 domain-containing protein n=1 Tax=Amycolatopsis ultiminotia TaxID=543629 RepID=A0ABP6UZ32_9PSEU
MRTAELHRSLRESRESVAAAPDGLGEYELRRPMTATSLLGLVRHLAGIEFGYLGDCVGRRRRSGCRGWRTAPSGKVLTCGPAPTSRAST